MAFPTGLTQAQAVLRVQNRCNEPNIPTAATIVDFLNDGLEQVMTELGPNRTMNSTAVVANTATAALPEDVQTIRALFWSGVAPFSAGYYPYEIQLFDQKVWSDYSGGVPTIGAGPSYAASVYQDESGIMTAVFAPPLQAGFLVTFYDQRSSLYDPNVTTSTTNLEPAYQTVAQLYACQLVCESLENYVKAKYFGDQFLMALERARITAGRRKTNRPSFIRDVTSQNIGPYPLWWPTVSG